MSFDTAAVNAAIAEHGAVTRVVVAALRGSAPREIGAAMLVWKDGISSTIGGGALEMLSIDQARAGQLGTSQHALGPGLGQCCGGHVTLVTEQFAAPVTEGSCFVRNIGSSDQPLTIAKHARDIRNGSAAESLIYTDGWISEAVTPAATPLWIWGAGHVGRAIVHVMSQLPQFDITWVDTGPERFPKNVPVNVTTIPAKDPALLMCHAPTHAKHLIFTYSHPLDLALCHAALTRGFADCGLIGSATKWARFRSRLGDLGHTAHRIDQITCPIGDPSLGKHPMAIALGVSQRLIIQPSAQIPDQRRSHLA